MGSRPAQRAYVSRVYNRATERRGELGASRKRAQSDCGATRARVSAGGQGPDCRSYTAGSVWRGDARRRLAFYRSGDGSRRAGVAAGVYESGEHAAGARVRAAPRDRHSPGHRRRTRAGAAAVIDRECAVSAPGQRTRHGARLLRCRISEVQDAGSFWVHADRVADGLARAGLYARVVTPDRRSFWFAPGAAGHPTGSDTGAEKRIHPRRLSSLALAQRASASDDNRRGWIRFSAPGSDPVWWPAAPGANQKERRSGVTTRA